MLRYVYFLAAAGMIGLAAAPGQAQQTLGDTIPRPEPGEATEAERDDFSGFIGLGAGAQPRYEGADRYQLSPFAIAAIDWKGLEFQVRGLRARVDLFGESPFMFGPAIGTRGNRNRDDTPARLDGLNPIGRPIEVGGFIGYRFGGGQTGQGEIGVDLTVTKDVNNAHDGVIASGQISYALIRTQRFFADVDAQATYGDGKFMRTYFGITPAEAGATGLRAYRPGSGFRDVQLGITAGYQFNNRWGLVGRVGASQYIGDAKDSPIVEEGSKTQLIGGLGLTYRF